MLDPNHPKNPRSPLRPLPGLIFASRRLQLPLYLGLIAGRRWSTSHLLKTFINADNYSDRVLIAQTAIHITFLLSAMAIAYTDRIMSGIRVEKH
jgi:uncharacterized membrane protein YqhA